MNVSQQSAGLNESSDIETEINNIEDHTHKAFQSGEIDQLTYDSLLDNIAMLRIEVKPSKPTIIKMNTSSKIASSLNRAVK